MTILNAATIAIRVLAVVLLIYLLRQISGAWSFYMLDTTEYPWFPWITTFALGLLCAAMWLLPVTIAALVTPKHLHNIELREFNPHAIEQASISIIGLWLVVWAIPDLVNNTFAAIMFNAGSIERLDALNFLVTTVLEFVIGLFLLIRTTGVYNLIRKLRESTVSEDDA